MKITAITQQQRRSDRYSIFVDGKFSFSLSAQTLLESGLRNGQELQPAELHQLKNDARYDKAYYRTLELIVRRKRSEWEITQYLKRKGYDEELAFQLTKKLRQEGYINDKAFAASWIENRRLLKSISRRRLKQELRSKRVSDEIIETTLGSDTTNERVVLEELVRSKKRQTKYQDDLKLMQYLARQGFNYDDIKAVVKEES